MVEIDQISKNNKNKSNFENRDLTQIINKTNSTKIFQNEIDFLFSLSLSLLIETHLHNAKEK